MATRVDFYVISDAEPRARAKFACALVEKAFALGNNVYLHCSDAAEAAALDTLLWTFRDRSFVPHALGGDGKAAGDEPVLVGHGDPGATLNDMSRDVLINLAPGVPAWFDSFERVAEVISEEPAVKLAGRERFRVYRDRGCTPETHRIGGEQ